VWIVIPMKIVTKGKPAEVKYAAIEDRRGRTYLADGARSQYSPGVSQPGIPRYASVVVEVPEDAVQGARLRVALNSLDTRRDDMADIDLGLTAADATAWAGSEKRIRLSEPADTPPPVPGGAGRDNTGNGTGKSGTGKTGTGESGTGSTT
jgi:hypothetical protein